MAYRPAVSDQPEMRLRKFFLRYRRNEFFLDLFGSLAGTYADSVCHPKDVGIHRHRSLTEGFYKHDIGCFSSDAGKNDEFAEVGRNYPSEALDEKPWRQLLYSWPWIYTGRPILSPSPRLKFSPGPIFRGWISAEKSGSHPVDLIIGGLRGKGR